MPRRLAAILSAIVLTGCGGTAGRHEPLPRGTIQSIMADGVDPSADAIWAAVGTVETAAGTRTAEPRTEADWHKLEEQALHLIDAAKQLDGLPPAVPPNAEVADADTLGTRTGAEIDRDIQADPAAFRAQVQTLDQAAREILAALRKRDTSAVLTAGERLDAACDACHFQYWHPRTRPQAMPAAEEFEKHRL